MRVALLNNNYIENPIGRYAIRLFDMLKKRDDIEIDQYFFNRGDWALYKLTGDEEIECIHVTRKNLLYDNTFFMKYGISNVFLDYRLGRYVPNDYDLYHLVTQEMSILNYYQNISKDVITLHDIFHYTYPRNCLEKWFSKPILYKGLKNSKFIISISNVTKNDLIKYFKIPEERIEVIYQGVNDYFKPLNSVDIENTYSKYDIDKNYRYILHIGNPVPRKNTITLIKAFYKLINEFKIKNVKLIKVNKVDNETDKMIKKLNLHEHIKIVDYVSEEDLPKIYNIADVFVFPSLSEGFGRPPLEAMACGIPVITSNTSAIPEVVGDAGLMLRPMDVDGFAKAMYEVLTNKGLRQDMRKKGLERAKKFTWEKIVEEVIKVYEYVASL